MLLLPEMVTRLKGQDPQFSFDYLAVYSSCNIAGLVFDSDIKESAEDDLLLIQPGFVYVKHFLKDQYPDKIAPNSKNYILIKKIHDEYLPGREDYLAIKHSRELKKFNGIPQNEFDVINTPNFKGYLRSNFPNIDTDAEIDKMNGWRLRNIKEVSNRSKKRFCDWTAFAIKWITK